MKELVSWGENTIENINYLIEKAKSKKDGAYSSRGIVYRVANNKVTHYGCNGKIYERCGHFVVQVGKYEWSDECKKILKNMK